MLDDWSHKRTNIMCNTYLLFHVGNGYSNALYVTLHLDSVSCWKWVVCITTVQESRFDTLQIPSEFKQICNGRIAPTCTPPPTPGYRPAIDCRHNKSLLARKTLTFDILHTLNGVMNRIRLDYTCICLLHVQSTHLNLTYRRMGKGRS